LAQEALDSKSSLIAAMKKKNTILGIVLVALLIAAGLVYFNSHTSTIADEPLTDFAIEDTAQVTKVIITDHFGKSAVVERVPGQRLWRLNGKYQAREDAVNLMLKTFNRIRIRGNVSDSSRDNMMKLLATSGKRVEIYTGGDEPAKIWYVSIPTPDHTGTIMLLEIPGIGRSEEPYITHLEGFTGFLSTRFFTDEMEWRYTGIFEYPHLEVSKVHMINHLIPADSWEVRFGGGNNLELYSCDAIGNCNQKISRFDTVAVKNQLLLFKKVHVESFNTQLSAATCDSLRATQPAYTLSVTDNAGQTATIDLLMKMAAKPTEDDYGNIIPFDLDYYWARTQEGEIAMAQSYNFGPLLNPIAKFSPVY
jgi:hypothetical protein